MKCFHFTNNNNNNNNNHREPNNNTISRGVSWARSFSIASSASSRKSEFDFDSSSLSLSLSSSSSSTRPRANVLRVFTFSELKSATRGFSRSLVIGEGGFGCVFRGVVDGVDVAVKQLNRNGLQGHKEWINEVNFMGVVSHPNLVKLVGYCAEDDERGMQRLLVYELMHNRSLEDHLLARARVPSALPWMTRLKIAQDAANGLAYLHEEMDFQLIFRDFKTSNILLDEDFNAKLSDFGLARQGPPEGLSHVSTAVVGTVGYAAPEYIHTGRLTSKSDVWSFGVVLYELITGRRAVERNRPRCEQKLLEWAKPYASDSKKFYLIVDPQLEGNYCIKSALKVASLANRCLMKQPKLRPKMSEVVEILGSIIDATLSQDERISRSVCEIEDVKEEGVEETNTESKQRSNYRKKVLDMKEMIILRNKSIGKLDWRNWTHGVVRTW